jgi:hypothetical protein
MVRVLLRCEAQGELKGGARLPAELRERFAEFQEAYRVKSPDLDALAERLLADLRSALSELRRELNRRQEAAVQGYN